MTPAWSYRAARSDGGRCVGTVDASSHAEAVQCLVVQGLHPLAIAPAASVAFPAQRAGRRDIAAFFQSLDALIGAGVPLDQALVATQEVVAGALRAAIPGIRERLRQGSSLSAALEATGHLSAPVFGALRAGERGGQLRDTLHLVAERLEAEAELAGRVRQALAYPLVLLVAGMTSVAIIAIVVLPRFAALLGETGQALPPATRFLLQLSSLGQRFGLIVALLVAAAVITLIALIRDGPGRLKWHRLALEAPVAGRIRHGLATARLTGALAGMLRSGVPLLVALREAQDAAGDAAVAYRMSRVRERVSGGEPLAHAALAERALTPSALQLIAVGEQSGQLALMVDRASHLAGIEAERGLRTMVALTEPALVIGLGGLVAFVAAALLQAVYALRPA